MQKIDYSVSDSFYVDVTPKMAEEWLENHNKRNRTVRQRTVDAYARDMADGRWEQNGVPIIFDKKGVLLDGQHRLWAIFESGIAVKLLVVTGAESGTYIDCGVGRNMTDRLVMGGICSKKDVRANMYIQSAASLAISETVVAYASKKIPIDLKLDWMNSRLDTLEKVVAIIQKATKTTKNIKSGSVILAMVAALESGADLKSITRWYSLVASDVYAEEEEYAAVKFRSFLNQLPSLSGISIREDVYLRAQCSISNFIKKNPSGKIQPKAIYDTPRIKGVWR